MLFVFIQNSKFLKNSNRVPVSFSLICLLHCSAVLLHLGYKFVYINKTVCEWYLWFTKSMFPKTSSFSNTWHPCISHKASTGLIYFTVLDQLIWYFSFEEFLIYFFVFLLISIVFKISPYIGSNIVIVFCISK